MANPLISIGLIGEIVMRLYQDSQPRPKYMIREQLGIEEIVPEKSPLALGTDQAEIAHQRRIASTASKSSRSRSG